MEHATRRTTSSDLDLLTLEERADLERLTAGRPAVARSAAAEAYVSGRVAGLCREGALELAADAIRDSR